MSWSRNAFLILVVAAGCRGIPSAVPLVRDGVEYEQTLARVQSLTAGPFKAMREGHPLSVKEQADLKTAGNLLDGLIGFAPTKYSLYVIKGMLFRGLGDQEVAVAALKQAIVLAPQNPQGADRAVIGQVYGLLSAVSFEKGDFAAARDEAQRATEFAPTDPEMWTNYASALVQMKDISLATDAIQKALELDPKFARAIALKRLLSAETPKN